jgi:hypothetical protein
MDEDRTLPQRMVRGVRRRTAMVFPGMSHTRKHGRDAAKVRRHPVQGVDFQKIFGERAGTRTQDLLIKSQLLYRLSYALLERSA